MALIDNVKNHTHIGNWYLTDILMIMYDFLKSISLKFNTIISKPIVHWYLYNNNSDIVRTYQEVSVEYGVVTQ